MILNEPFKISTLFSLKFRIAQVVSLISLVAAFFYYVLQRVWGFQSNAYSNPYHSLTNIWWYEVIYNEFFSIGSWLITHSLYIFLFSAGLTFLVSFLKNLFKKDFKKKFMESIDNVVVSLVLVILIEVLIGLAATGILFFAALIGKLTFKDLPESTQQRTERQY